MAVELPKEVKGAVLEKEVVGPRTHARQAPAATRDTKVTQWHIQFIRFYEEGEDGSWAAFVVIDFYRGSTYLTTTHSGFYRGSTYWTPTHSDFYRGSTYWTPTHSDFCRGST